MKTFIGAVLSLGNYQMVTIDEKAIGEYEFAFEVNWQETGVTTTTIGLYSYKYPKGGFDMRIYKKGVPGDLEINGWKFPGLFNGTYECQENSAWKSFLNITVIDPEGNTEDVIIGDYNGIILKCFYSSIALNYLEKIFEFCLYKNIKEHASVTKFQLRDILQQSWHSPEQILEEFSILQIMKKSVEGLDDCEDIPEHIKEAARQKYKSLLTQIKKSADFEEVLNKLLGFEIR